MKWWWSPRFVTAGGGCGGNGGNLKAPSFFILAIQTRYTLLDHIGEGQFATVHACALRDGAIPRGYEAPSLARTAAEVSSSTEQLRTKRPTFAPFFVLFSHDLISPPSPRTPPHFHFAAYISLGRTVCRTTTTTMMTTTTMCFTPRMTRTRSPFQVRPLPLGVFFFVGCWVCVGGG